MVRFAMQSAVDEVETDEAPRPVSKRCRTDPPLDALEPGVADLDGDDGPLAALFDPDTLDCGVCMEPLCPPIFQCSNGHIACTGCCLKMNNVCPTCRRSTGKIRCLAIEKLIESLHVRCKYAEYGCQKVPKYMRKKAHETECDFAPFACPLPGCDHSGPMRNLSSHFLDAHEVHTTDIKLAKWCSLPMDGSRHRILKVAGMLFLFVVEREALGSLAYLCYVGSVSNQETYMYNLRVNWGRNRLLMQSVSQCAQQGGKRPGEFLLVPSSASAGEQGCEQIELYIHPPGETSLNAFDEGCHLIYVD